MADWAEDDNPFAPSDNTASPFNDPAVAQAQGSSTMPEYDPFSASIGGASPKQAPAPAPAGPADAPDWATPDAPAPKNATAEEQRRAKDYDAAEAQTEVKKDPGYRPANWPPFPERCVWPFKPCFHHDFRGELPAYGYAVTKHGYYYWCGYFFTLFWNMICAAAAMTTYSGSDVALGLAFAYLFLFGPLSYVCWFQSLYKAIMKDGASNLTWGWFFFSYLFQWIFVCIMALGYPGFGGVGIWTASKVVSKDTGIGILTWTCAGMWVMLALYQAYHMRWALLIFKSSGGSFEGAQKEAQQMAAAGAVAAATAK